MSLRVKSDIYFITELYFGLAIAALMKRSVFVLSYYVRVADARGDSYGNRTR